MMVNLTENAWKNLGHSCSTLPKMPNAVAGNAATNSLQSITPLNDWYPHIACRCHLRFISTLNSLYPSRPLESASFNFWPQGWWLSLKCLSIQSTILCALLNLTWYVMLSSSHACSGVHCFKICQQDIINNFCTRYALFMCSFEYCNT